ncbi:MAG: hypothetical protein JKY96_00285 [Phycisphaerales bacterium]|nr:hypothetical protein [Phycisphaerales bacterium]
MSNYANTKYIDEDMGRGLGNASLTLRILILIVFSMPLIGGCATNQTPIRPVATKHLSQTRMYDELRVVNKLLGQELYQEALVRVRQAIEKYPQELALQEPLKRAQQGVERLNAKPATRDEALGRLTTRNDEVDGIRWYRHKYGTSQTGTRMSVYFGQSLTDPDRIWMRMTPRFEGGKWKFIRDFTVVAGGQRFDWVDQEFKRDHRTSMYRSASRPSTTVWEWVDIAVGEKERCMIETVISSSDAVLRFRGENGNHDYAFSELDRLIYQDVLTAFEVLRTR